MTSNSSSHQRSQSHMTYKKDQDDQFKDWTHIYENQRQQQIVSDKYQKEEDTLRKRMYREQLNNTIQQQREQVALNRNNDQEHIIKDNEIRKQMNEKDRQQALKTKSETQACLSESTNYTQQRHYRDQQVKQQDADYRAEQVIRMKQEDDHTLQMNRMNKQLVKESWLKDYDLHHNHKQQYLQTEKSIDTQLSQNQLQMLIRQDYDRKVFQDRIRGGYKQNLNVLQHYDQVYAERTQEQINRDERIIHEVTKERQKQDDLEIFNRQKKQKLQNDILSGLTQQMQEKQESILQQREYKREIKQEIDDYNAQQYHSQLEESQMKVQQKQFYSNQLRQQIEQDRERKRNPDELSAMEIKMNNRNIDSKVALPGLSATPNFERKKQTDYLDYNLNRINAGNFLLNKKQGTNSSYNTLKNSSAVSVVNQSRQL